MLHFWRAWQAQQQSINLEHLDLDLEYILGVYGYRMLCSILCLAQVQRGRRVRNRSDHPTLARQHYL